MRTDSLSWPAYELHKVTFSAYCCRHINDDNHRNEAHWNNNNDNRNYIWTCPWLFLELLRAQLHREICIIYCILLYTKINIFCIIFIYIIWIQIPIFLNVGRVSIVATLKSHGQYLCTKTVCYFSKHAASIKIVDNTFVRGFMVVWNAYSWAEFSLNVETAIEKAD